VGEQVSHQDAVFALLAEALEQGRHRLVQGQQAVLH